MIVIAAEVAPRQPLALRARLASAARVAEHVVITIPLGIVGVFACFAMVIGAPGLVPRAGGLERRLANALLGASILRSASAASCEPSRGVPVEAS